MRLTRSETRRNANSTTLHGSEHSQMECHSPVEVAVDLVRSPAEARLILKAFLVGNSI